MTRRDLPPQPTARDLAMALVAAAGVVHILPDRVFDPGQTARRARILAGAALKASTGCAGKPLAATLKLAGPELSPSMLVKAKVTTDMMLEVVEALHHGLPKPASQPAVEPRPLPSAAEAAGLARKPAAKPADKPKPVNAVRPVAEPAPPRASKSAAAPREPRPTARPAPEEAPSDPAATAVRRLKPMTAAKLRFGRWFVTAGWDLEEVAELFDVHEDALADALEFGVAA